MNWHSNLNRRSKLTQCGKLALAAIALATIWFRFQGWPVEQNLSVDGIAVDQNAGYVARLEPWTTLSWLRVDVDSETNPQASRLRLTENGQLQGPAHSAHDDIRSNGRGRYSHWNDSSILYFSPSDGSDPRSNGRTYRASTVARPPRSVAWLAGLVLLTLTWAELSNLRRAYDATSRAGRAVVRSALVRVAAALALAVLLLLGILVGVPLQQSIEPQQIAHEQNFAYRTTLQPWQAPWPFAVKADSSNAPAQSNALVFENERPLGPAHAEHDRIRSAGAGRYSHWNEARAIYFSTRDNSDPRSNGREYVVRVRAELPWWTFAIAAALLGYSLFAARPFISRGVISARLRWERQAGAARVLHIGLAASARAARIVLPSLIGCVLILVLVLAIGEAYFRLTVPFSERTWPVRYVAGVGWLFEPNALVKHTNDIDFWIEEKANSLGFLDRERPLVDPQQSCRVVLIGDSFVEAAQVNNHEKVQAQLERIAAERKPPLPISAMAFGASGTGQLHQLPFYDRYARLRSPDLVVLVFVANDFANNSSVLESIRHGFHPDHPPRMSATRDSQSGQVSLQMPDPEWQKHIISLGDDVIAPTCWLCRQHRRLFSSSLFYRWMIVKLRLLAPQLLVTLEPRATKSVGVARWEWLAAQPKLAGNFGNWAGTPDVDEMFFRTDLPPVFTDALQFTEFALAEFKKRVAVDKGHLIVLSASHVRKPRAENADQYFNRMRTIADKLGIPVLDQHEWLQRRNEPLSSVEFRHEGHWNRRGHQVAAQMIFEYIVANPDSCNFRKTN